MYPRSFTRLRPGQQPTAADWNALVDYLSQHEQAAGTARGSMGVAFGAGGIQLLDGTTPGHWAKIKGTASGYKYAHVMVAPNADGTWTELPQTADYSWGDPTNGLPAVEVNQNASVPTDGSVVAWLEPDPTIPGYRFTAPATASNRLWVKITSGTDASGYAGTRQAQTAPGTWADYPVGAPHTFTSGAIRRTPSNTVTGPGGPPDLQAGDVVEVVPSLTQAGTYETRAESLEEIEFTVMTDGSFNTSTCVFTKVTSVIKISGRGLKLQVV